MVDNIPEEVKHSRLPKVSISGASPPRNEGIKALIKQISLMDPDVIGSRIFVRYEFYNCLTVIYIDT
ncbi:unnamed protein product [Acanthoscelides obtectus]|uniref:Uncharacterized protein n=1 Tax=Acanthoscelides obtectus TaxID=200917 RepID=A0A9P0L3R6_ACAOB|nr:unnamed protein product [Acanthoscelides obtectus]CAK1626927.1 hypothetical protein AOBTE_LOCUS4155 [Acanthoscelides obtectus]